MTLQIIQTGIMKQTNGYYLVISRIQLGHKILLLTHKILLLAMSKISPNQLVHTRIDRQLKNIIITNWSCHKLGKTANNIVLFNPQNCFYVAAIIILHFFWMLNTISFLLFLPIKVQQISLEINGSIM